MQLDVHINRGSASDPAVSATPAPLEGDDNPCRTLIDPCRYTVTAGKVTLSATPTDTPIRWSDPACGSAHVCETTVDADTSIVAIFLPVSLSVQLSGRGAQGDGLVRVTEVARCTGAACTRVNARSTFPTRRPRRRTRTAFCTFVYPTITEVDVQAVPWRRPPSGTGLPGSAGTADHPVRGLAERLPDAGRLRGAEPVPGFLVSVLVRVVRQGTGKRAGDGQRNRVSVLLLGVDPIRVATPPTATADAGSTSDRWLNARPSRPDLCVQLGRRHDGPRRLPPRRPGRRPRRRPRPRRPSPRRRRRRGRRRRLRPDDHPGRRGCALASTRSPSPASAAVGA